MDRVVEILNKKGIKYELVEHEEVYAIDDMEKLGLLDRGYVSPFGVLNDESKSVIFVFDRELQDKDKVGFHPNTNKATVYLAFKDVKKIIEDHGNDVVFIRI